MMKLKTWKWNRTISMKVPLFLVLVLIGFVPLVVESKVMTGSFSQIQIENRMNQIQNQCLILSNKMTRSAYMVPDSPDELISGEMDAIADIFNGRVIIVDKEYKVVKDTFNLAVGKTNVSEEVIRCFQGENSSKYHKDKHYLALTTPIYDGTPEKAIAGVMVVTASTEHLLTLVDQSSEKIRFFQLVLLWLLVLVAIAFIMMLMRPFKRLQTMLNRVADGNMDEIIAENAYMETKQISSAVNMTLTKLKTVDRSREEFVSNVSHELKTPITSIRVLADSLMAMEEVPVELYREFMADISDEIDRESKIIDDLLSLVRMDKAATEMNISQIEINGLLQQILKRLRPIAKKRNVELIFESIRDVAADADEVKLSLALNNLVENAIKYNVEGGWVRVVLDADHKFFYVKVSDSGIGIPEEFQEHIFERFYRVDKARSRETGGTGLGLSITRNVILMHKGAIKVTSKEGEGSTFTVRVPLTYIN